MRRHASLEKMHTLFHSLLILFICLIGHVNATAGARVGDMQDQEVEKRFERDSSSSSISISISSI